MLPNFLIGLREGLEAALVVGIIVAYLVRSGRRASLRWVGLGVALAVVLSLAVGAVLTFTSNSLSFTAQETFGGAMSIIAVGFVTWMVFWMRRTAHQMKGELHDRIEQAIGMGAGALTVASFLAVGREGLETALFLWPNLQNPNSAGAPIGAVAGLLASVALGYLLYKRSIKLNLAKFFRYTGIGLVVVAAGVLAYGLHDLQEAGVLPGLAAIAFDVRAQIPPTSWYGTLLKGTVNFSPETTWLQLVAWFAYLVPVLVAFLRPVRPQPATGHHVAAGRKPVATPIAKPAGKPAPAPTH
jgi:high-affinity iron transporter